MAEARTASKSKATRKSSPRKTRARSTKTSARSKSSPTPRTKAARNGSSHVVEDGAKAVRSAVSSAGKEAGHAASRARIPLLAGGAAVVGTVGGIAIGASRSGDKVLGVKLPKSRRVKLRSADLSRVAKEVGHFGENVGELTAELKRAREGLANGEGKQSSPIEVLLSGLTSRR